MEFDEVLFMVRKYIYFYNKERYQQRLNGLSQLEYRVQTV
ncbi:MULTISPECIES: IS3 family transposase [Exiguobacterium]|nr:MULTISPECIES: IS3 family transposase [Exiguobacterium]